MSYLMPLTIFHAVLVFPADSIVFFYKRVAVAQMGTLFPPTRIQSKNKNAVEIKHSEYDVS